MQIVINIPDGCYEELNNGQFPVQDAYRIVAWIKDGTPLPKGHNGLIDIGQCDRKLFYQQCGGADSLITAKSAFDMLMSLPTIIEIDKTESEQISKIKSEYFVVDDYGYSDKGLVDKVNELIDKVNELNAQIPIKTESEDKNEICHKKRTKKS